jgi:hypothetical protein
MQKSPSQGLETDTTYLPIAGLNFFVFQALPRLWDFGNFRKEASCNHRHFRCMVKKQNNCESEGEDIFDSALAGGNGEYH